MKKIILVLIILSSLLILSISSCNNFNSLNISNKKIYVNAKQEEKHYLDLGFLTQIEIYNNYTQEYNGIVAETININGNSKMLNKIISILGVNIIDKIYLNNLIVMQGYSGKVSYDTINNFNIQIAYDGETITLGIPIIIGEY